MNPNQFIQQIISNNKAMQNPMINNAYQLMQRNDVNGLREMANNLCKEKGLNIQDLENQIRNRFGM